MKVRNIVILLYILFTFSFASDRIPAKVLSIVDGDTIKVLINGRVEKVRLIGIDTPESRINRRANLQARRNNKDVREIINMGKLAKEHLGLYLLEDDTIYLEFDVQKRDRYGRLLAYVWKDGLLINKEMICDGYAYPLTIPPNTKYADEFRECFKEAREEGTGLWESQAQEETTDENFKESGFKCGNKRYCKQMTSCEEAKFYLNVCGLKRLDRDRDGIPCESLCR